MRIVVDAMGTDDFPVADVAGAVQAARDFGDTILLVGQENIVQAELAKHDTTGLDLQVIHAEEIISMTDKPAIVSKEKPNSSMHVGMNLVKNGEADAFISAGNTGAAHVIATLYTLGRIRGIKRPALTSIVRFEGKSMVLLDVGANTDTKPEWLVQFAKMGTIYAERVLKQPNPTVGLLANGEEDSKGDQRVQETADLLRATDLNFIGNVEPKQILQARADVVVMDGFVGNIAIKMFEAAVRHLFTDIRAELKSNLPSQLGGALARPALRRVYNKIDTEEIGGAPLLGIDGVVIIGHGSSSPKAITACVRQARQAVAGNLIQAIKEDLQKAKA